MAEFARILPAGLKATEAIRHAQGDPNLVDWAKVEDQTMIEAMGRNGQPANSVLKALLKHSPGAVTPEQQTSLQNRVSMASDVDGPQHPKPTDYGLPR